MRPCLRPHPRPHPRPLASPRVAVVLATSIAVGALLPSLSAAQGASFTYRLGTDTLAVEQFTRTASAINGETVQRSGAAVTRFTYSVSIGKDGRPTAARVTRLQGDGTPFPGAPREVRFAFGPDSAIRETIFADSTQRRAFAVKGAMVNFPVFVYGPTELLAAQRTRGGSDSIPAIGLGGGMGYTGLTALGGDSARLKGAPYAMVLRFDANGRLQSLDGSGTTNKAQATRGAAGADIAALARTMKATGVLSLREDARAGFGPGGMVIVDYGRPHVRERTVWGGMLVPFDSVWRAGANDATHLITTRTLTLGSMTLAPGMYTLWVQHTRGGTFLIVNRQTGQWGTQYDASQDIGRVALQSAPSPSHVEELTIAVRARTPAQGTLELAWGDRVMSVPFGVSAAR